jgi:SAM-dependent methyltransferase
MHAVALPEIATAYDTVGVYDQDAINGFSDHILTTLLELVNPGQVSHILDAMAGNGNLTARLYDYCERRGLFPPDVTMLEFSRVQCELAQAQLAETPATVVWGDILTMEDYDNDAVLPSGMFDRVMLKSGNHEIPLHQQLDLYKSLFRVLKPRGLLVNLGFLFDDGEERDQFRDIARCKDSLAGMQSAVGQSALPDPRRTVYPLAAGGVCRYPLRYVRALYHQFSGRDQRLLPGTPSGTDARRISGPAGQGAAFAPQGPHSLPGGQQHDDYPRRDHHCPPSAVRPRHRADMPRLP